MAAKSVDVPRFSYVLAIVAGLMFMPLSLMFGMFVGTLLDKGGANYWPVALTIFAVGYIILGAAFGLVWPENTWRWGVWLSAAPACLVSFFSDGAPFLWMASLTLIPTCAGAYVAARIHLKYAEVS